MTTKEAMQLAMNRLATTLGNPALIVDVPETLDSALIQRSDTTIE